MRTATNAKARIVRPYMVGVRVSQTEKDEIDDLARETRLGTSALMRYAFTLAREHIAKAKTVCAESEVGNGD